mgnify:CR=1 FL=1
MKLFVGLGNPGTKYARNRHNIGFMAVDGIIRRHSFSPERQKFQALMCDGLMGGEKVVALKPQTYMNESGQSVGEAMRFFKLEPKDVIVFYDELDLAPGKIRVKLGGGAAGHNGIRSIASHIGPEFRRVRIGIGHPGHKDAVMPYVLGDFSKAQHADWLDAMLDAIADAAPMLAEGKDATFANKVHLAIHPEPPKKAKPASDKKPNE